MDLWYESPLWNLSGMDWTSLGLLCSLILEGMLGEGSQLSMGWCHLVS
jgi:hypothetical protein